MNTKLPHTSYHSWLASALIPGAYIYRQKKIKRLVISLLSFGHRYGRCDWIRHAEFFDAKCGFIGIRLLFIDHRDSARARLQLQLREGEYEADLKILRNFREGGEVGLERA